MEDKLKVLFELFSHPDAIHYGCFAVGVSGAVQPRTLLTHPIGNMFFGALAGIITSAFGGFLLELVTPDGARPFVVGMLALSATYVTARKVIKAIIQPKLASYQVVNNGDDDDAPPLFVFRVGPSSAPRPPAM